MQGRVCGGQGGLGTFSWARASSEPLRRGILLAMSYDRGHLSNTALVLLPEMLGLLPGAGLGPGQARGVLGPGQQGAGE